MKQRWPRRQENMEMLLNGLEKYAKIGRLNQKP
jgi:hypothetical protein